MSLLEKVRNFFYDDEYEEEDEKEIPKIKPKEKIKPKKEKHIFVEDKREEQKISERELFKAERTFNFPMDVEDENDFIVEEKPKVIPKKEEVKPVEKPKITSYDSIRTYAKYEEKKEERNEPKKFKPTPVISPIYGIMDKNYTKEDLVIDNSVKQEPVKKVDYDTVRRRAYSNVYNDEEEKGIFFNLDEQHKKEEKKEEDEEVKIIYNDVTLDDEKDEDVTIGHKIEEYEKSIKNDIDFEEDEDTTILSETKEQDLFNLIDNMYNSEDEDEEEE